MSGHRLPYNAPITAEAGGRLRAEAVARNRASILAVLERTLPAHGTVLEIGSGTGEHAVFFAPRLAGVRWRTSDPDPAMRASIEAWRRAEPVTNVEPPLDIDVHHHPWPVAAGSLAAVVAVNVLHIAPWSACAALLDGAARVLTAGGVVVLYGPYRRDGRHVSAGNEAFDRSLRARNPTWGVRDAERVVSKAEARGLSPVETIAMPNNNTTLVFRK